MIEDEKLGLKVAENPVEAVWIGIKEKCEKGIINSKIEIEINENLKKLAETKIKKK